MIDYLCQQRLHLHNPTQQCRIVLLSIFYLINLLIEFIFQLYTNKCAYMFRYFVGDGMLQIMNVNLSDQGTYTCIARTSLDEDNATALLTVLGKMVL